MPQNTSPGQCCTLLGIHAGPKEEINSVDEYRWGVTNSCKADDSVSAKCVIYSEFEWFTRLFAYLAFPMFDLHRPGQITVISYRSQWMRPYLSKKLKR